ncbi:MAG: ATP-binding protein [Cellvibrionaceae bacterium]
MLASNPLSLDLKIGHRLWEEALALAFSLLVSVMPGEVVCITGPSRVGKTKLIEELCELLGSPANTVSEGKMLNMAVKASNTGTNGTFSTKMFTQRMLEIVKHPILSISNESTEVDFLYQKLNRTTESTLRMALEHALQARGVKYLFIDEAQHASYVSKGAQGAYAVMDSWKCLAETADVVLVLVGAYPILDIIRNSPHLIGRKYQVHFPRYQLNKSDLREFASIIAMYEKYMPVCESTGGLYRHVEMIHYGTLGCIGLLRKWFVHAAAVARAKKVNIDLELLQETHVVDADFIRIREEIIHGENILIKKKHNNTKEDLNKITSPRHGKKIKPFQKKPVRQSLGNRSKGKG